MELNRGEKEDGLDKSGDVGRWENSGGRSSFKRSDLTPVSSDEEKLGRLRRERMKQTVRSFHDENQKNEGKAKRVDRKLSMSIDSQESEKDREDEMDLSEELFDKVKNEQEKMYLQAQEDNR